MQVDPASPRFKVISNGMYVTVQAPGQFDPESNSISLYTTTVVQTQNNQVSIASVIKL